MQSRSELVTINQNETYIGTTYIDSGKKCWSVVFYSYKIKLFLSWPQSLYDEGKTLGC